MSQTVSFNELSTKPLCASIQEVIERVDRFVDLYKALYALGYKRISSELVASQVMLTDNLSLYDLCKQHMREAKYILLANNWGCPTIPEKDATARQAYKETIVELLKDGEWVNVEGFSWAVAANTFCAGLRSEAFWDGSLFMLRITKEDGDERKEWLCISDASQLTEEGTKQWIECHQPLELKPSELSEEEKRKTIQNIRHDHGEDVLREFAERLVKCPYVEGIINSLPYNPQEKNFIHNIYSDGRIELVLTDTDKGLGLVVKTTGTTTMQTDAIADILKKKYSR